MLEREFKIRTDLAVELKEDVESEDIISRGIRVIESRADNNRIKITRVIVENEEGMRTIGKDMGSYITLESPQLAEADEDYHREMSVQIAKYVKELLPKKNNLKVLVVGLGNRDATPDSLGPRVVDNICITRRMTDEYAQMGLVNKCRGFEVSGIIPGVLAQTGMESAEIVKGIVDEIKPDVVIAIDSLAARNTSRLNTTIQISDTGINPGSGVGNHRRGLTIGTIGVPVIAIGIPTVVDAATIVNDTFENLLGIFKMTEGLSDVNIVLDEFTSEEKYELIKELAPPSVSTMYVTPKDVDATIKYISYTISEGLNIIWSENI
ncbi:MAG: GPR endopeptidase [Lachnospiraceae bacterium]|nr:GPR endopeptidase [Lachnospiraceae bacterium]